MKLKLIIILFSILLLPKVSFGILSDDLGLDLYKKIDKGVYDLNISFIERELKGGDTNGDIGEELNKILEINNLTPCFDEISTEDIIKTVNGDITILHSILSDCFGGPVQIQVLNSYRNVVSNYYIDKELQARDKIDNIYKISRISLYSDGIIENSPFDLIFDIDEINRIIFDQELNYVGVNTFDTSSVIGGILSGGNKSISQILAQNSYNTTSGDNSNTNQLTNSGNSELNTGSIDLNDLNDGNTQICPINNSGLSDELVDMIIKGNLSNLNGDSQNENNTQNGGGSNGGNDLGDNELGNDGLVSGVSSYSKVNDNKVWPCDNFFCITVEFITYTQNLLSGGVVRNIEGIINRSNEHIKKFAYTSLVQSKMTTNNFELGLKDVDLPSLFNISINISSKPVPILRLKSSENNDRDNSETSKNNLLLTYYKNLGLDYNRANDLNIFLDKENELKTILDSAELNMQQVAKKDRELKEIQALIRKENAVVSQSIDKQIQLGDTNDFYNMFLELEGFSKMLLDYSIDLQAIVRGMNEIPISN